MKFHRIGRSHRYRQHHHHHQQKRQCHRYFMNIIWCIESITTVASQVFPISKWCGESLLCDIYSYMYTMKCEAYSTAPSVMFDFWRVSCYVFGFCALFSHSPIRTRSLTQTTHTFQRETQTFKVYHFNQFEIIFKFILLYCWGLSIYISRSFFLLLLLCFRHIYNFKMIEWLNTIVSLCWLVLTLLDLYIHI